MTWRSLKWRWQDIILMLCLVPWTAVTATVATAAPAGPVVFALESEPERLDPLTIRNPQTFRIAWQIFEGLLNLSPDGKIEPRLAASWQTTDYRTWNFKLREDVVFQRSPLFGSNSPTRKLTADDVVWSYTAFCSAGAYASFLLTDSIEGCADYNAGKVTSVRGIKAVGPLEVQITLIQPEPFFLNKLTTPWIAVFPREAERPENKDKWGLGLVTGTGPYRMTSRSDSEYVLEPNAEYWNKVRIPVVDKLIFRVIKNPDIRMAALAKGTIDIAPIPAPLFPVLMDSNQQLRDQYRSSLELQSFDTYNISFIGFDTKLVSDLHLRRAMSLGTDREAIVRNLLRGFGSVIAGPIPRAMPGGQLESAGSTFQKYQPALAREELRSSSYRGQVLDMYVHDLAQSDRIGEIFQQQMKAIGVNIRLIKQDYGSVVGRALHGEAPLFGLYFELVFSSPEPELVSLFDSKSIPVPNFWKYTSQEVDRTLAKLYQLDSERDRVLQSAVLAGMIASDVPAIFLFSERHVLVHSRRLEHIVVNPNEYYSLDQLRYRQ